MSDYRDAMESHSYSNDDEFISNFQNSVLPTELGNQQRAFIEEDRGDFDRAIRNSPPVSLHNGQESSKSNELRDSKELMTASTRNTVLEDLISSRLHQASFNFSKENSEETPSKIQSQLDDSFYSIRQALQNSGGMSSSVTSSSAIYRLISRALSPDSDFFVTSPALSQFTTFLTNDHISCRKIAYKDEVDEVIDENSSPLLQVIFSFGQYMSENREKIRASFEDVDIYNYLSAPLPSDTDTFSTISQVNSFFQPQTPPQAQSIDFLEFNNALFSFTQHILVYLRGLTKISYHFIELLRHALDLLQFLTTFLHKHTHEESEREVSIFRSVSSLTCLIHTLLSFSSVKSSLVRSMVTYRDGSDRNPDTVTKATTNTSSLTSKDAKSTGLYVATVAELLSLLHVASLHTGRRSESLLLNGFLSQIYQYILPDLHSLLIMHLFHAALQCKLENTCKYASTSPKDHQDESILTSISSVHSSRGLRTDRCEACELRIRLMTSTRSTLCEKEKEKENTNGDEDGKSPSAIDILSSTTLQSSIWDVSLTLPTQISGLKPTCLDIYVTHLLQIQRDILSRRKQTCSQNDQHVKEALSQVPIMSTISSVDSTSKSGSIINRETFVSTLSEYAGKYKSSRDHPSFSSETKKTESSFYCSCVANKPKDISNFTPESLIQDGLCHGEKTLLGLAFEGIHSSIALQPRLSRALLAPRDSSASVMGESLSNHSDTILSAYLEPLGWRSSMRYFSDYPSLNGNITAPVTASSCSSFSSSQLLPFPSSPPSLSSPSFSSLPNPRDSVNSSFTTSHMTRFDSVFAQEALWEATFQSHLVSFIFTVVGVNTVVAKAEETLKAVPRMGPIQGLVDDAIRVQHAYFQLIKLRKRKPKVRRDIKHYASASETIQARLKHFHPTANSVTNGIASKEPKSTKNFSSHADGLSRFSSMTPPTASPFSKTKSKGWDVGSGDIASFPEPDYSANTSPRQGQIPSRLSSTRLSFSHPIPPPELHLLSIKRR